MSALGGFLVWSLAGLAGLLAARYLALTAGSVFDAPVLRRVNYRGSAIPTAGGLLVVFAVLLVEAGRATLGALGLGPEPGENLDRNLVVFACFAFGLLGLVDDLLGNGEERGFRGHLRALTEGRVTTGVLKVIGGAAAALVVVAVSQPVSGKRLVADALIVALAANLGNLLDRAPGRTIKVAFVAYIPLALLAGSNTVGVAVAPVMGAAAGVLGDDLRERRMLGDTGANVLGAVLGLMAVLVVGRGWRTVILVALLVLNIAAELTSFSRIIERVPLLRRLDQAGRPIDPPAEGRR